MSETTHPEFNYDAACFSITAMSNLHVGAGSENYGVIDNLVQRDPTTGFPCINASSLKGAIKEQFKHYLNAKESLSHIRMIETVFGGDKELNEWKELLGITGRDDEALRTGRFKFLQADLLSVPVRSDVKPYFNCTAPILNKHFLNQLQLFRLAPDATDIVDFKNSMGLDGQRAIQYEHNGNAILEVENLIASYHVAIPENAKSLIGCSPSLVKDDYFCMLVSDYHLPVIARNCLENGESKNLWYEQVLPRDTRLFFIVLYPKGDPNYDSFKNIMINNPIQIGANASVGHGWSKINIISTHAINHN
ncbi:MAG: hypothetical protein JPMHGGIA_01829 [Saprospiraceae bacterium]|nr:hypothetical protein [Saprospiraceae bacterium]